MVCLWKAHNLEKRALGTFFFFFFKQYFIEIFYIHAINTLSMDTGFDCKLKAYMKVIS